MTSVDRINQAAQAGQLLPAAAKNLTDLVQAGLPAWAQSSIEELVAKQAWSELNDRFYRYLEFGTGGMRGRTVGVTPATAETGQLDSRGSPEHAAIGSNMMNDFTVIRATTGLYRYMAKYLAQKSDRTKPR